MVAGHLREKKGYFYAVLNYTDAHGNRKTKWIATGLAVKGNKKRAEAFLQEQRRSFQEDVPITGDVLFADFMEQWLTVIKSSVAVTTFASYSNMVKKVIVPYFRERQIALQELSAKHIQDFYLKELERVSASSVIHYHANIHKALKYAVKLDLISSNPADKIERPKKERFMANFYDADEVNRLFEISKGTKLEIPILFGAFYGMRRSETLGMKWDAIDFERDTITIRHTLTTVALDGKRITVAEDRTKNKSSMRTLPLVPFVKERLLELKAEQEENRRLCGRSYVKDYTGYVCINEIGDIIKPNYVSCGFPKLLEEHGLRRVRYHDLRHSCASLLLANGVPMKQIQEWLGHSDFYALQTVMRLCFLPHTQIYPLSTSGWLQQESQFSHCAGTTRRSCGNSRAPPEPSSWQPALRGKAWTSPATACRCLSFPGCRLHSRTPSTSMKRETIPPCVTSSGASSCRKCRSSSSRALDAPSARKRTPAWLPSWMNDAAPEAATGRMYWTRCRKCRS